MHTPDNSGIPGYPGTTVSEYPYPGTRVSGINTGSPGTCDLGSRVRGYPVTRGTRCEHRVLVKPTNLKGEKVGERSRVGVCGRGFVGTRVSGNAT